MRSPFFDTGVVVYELDVILNTSLFFMLRRKRVRMWFFWYTGARLLVSVIRCTLFLTNDLETYSRTYWLTSPILLLLQILVIADLFPRAAKLVHWVAPSVFVLQLALVLMRSNSAILVEGCAQGLVAGFMVYALSKDWANLLAIGMLAVTAFPAIWDFHPAIMLNGYASRLLPCYLFLAAQLLWLYWAHRVTEDTVVPFAD